MKYTVDCFTEKWAGTKFPENSYYVDSAEEVSEIVRDCSRRIAGIRQVQIWIEEPDDGA